MLKEYKDNLEKEMAGVKEKIVTDEGVEWIPIRHLDKYVPREIHPDIREKLNGGLKQLYQRIMELKQKGVKSNIKQAILEAKEQGDPYIIRLIDWLEKLDIHNNVFHNIGKNQNQEKHSNVRPYFVALFLVKNSVQD